jgi:hypothetical protein
MATATRTPSPSGATLQVRRTNHHAPLNYERHLNCGCGAAGRPCIGFALGRTEDHQTSVADPSECRNLPKEAKAARNLLQQFIESSPHPPYEKLGHTGFWYTAPATRHRVQLYVRSHIVICIVPGERPSCVPLEPAKVA